MNRAILGAAGVMASLGIVACGERRRQRRHDPVRVAVAGGRGGFARNAAFGQLVQINGDDADPQQQHR